MKSVQLTSPAHGYPIHALLGGRDSAPTMLLLHGHMAHTIAFRRVWARLAQHFQLIALDLPGHGEDNSFRAPQVQPTMDSLEAWLLDLLNILPPARIYLVGHSLGASLALRAAQRAPHRFHSVTLTSPGFCVRVPPGAATLLDLLPAHLASRAITKRGLRVLEPFRWQGAPMSADELDAYLKPLQDLDRLGFSLRLGADLLRCACTPDALEPLSLPAQLIFGGRDTVVALDQAEAITHNLHAARLDIIPTAGHSPPEDTPLRFNDALLDFIDDLSSEQPRQPTSKKVI